MTLQKQSRKSLSLVVPVLNEEEVVSTFLDEIENLACELCEKVGRFEVVFVDDGSTDGTVDAIKAHRRKSLEIRIVKLSRNFRKDNALSAGLRYVTGDAAIPIDVDLQDPPELIPRMVDLWLDGAKIVNAKRASREADGHWKRFTSKAFYQVFNRVSDVSMDPNVGDFRLLDRQVVDILNQLPERVRFMKGLFAWVGFSPVTLYYERPERAAGQTKWTVWALWNFAMDGITGSSTLPLRAWTYLGSVIALLAMAFASFLVFRTIFYGIDVPGYASLMVVVLMMGAFNLVALGVFGEYIGRLNVEAKNRPIFVVDEVIELKVSGSKSEHDEVSI